MAKSTGMGKVFGVVLSTGSVAGAVNDLFSPLLSISGYAIAACLLLIAFSLCALAIPAIGSALAKIPVSDGIHEFFENYWAKPIIVGLIVLSTVLMLASFFTQRNSDNNGLLAATFPSLAVFQEELGIVNVKLSEISQNTNRAATGIESIDKKADNFKREVSEDPQKELSNMGVPWTNDGFGQALLRNDTRVVSLFLAAGWNLTSDFGEGNAIGHYVARGDMSNPSRVEDIFDMLVRHGLSVNAPIFRFRGTRAADIATSAVHGCNFTMLKIALARGADRGKAQLQAQSYMGAPDDSAFAHECEANKQRIRELLGV